MKFELDTAAGQNVITAYGDGYVVVNEQRYDASLIVTPTRVVAPWQPGRVGDLTASHFDFLLELKPEIVLLGTGRRIEFPPPALMRRLTNSNVGLEVMDSGAACRTYNVLVAERRNVVAAILTMSQDPQLRGRY
jgi:uncharacterized protein